MRPVDDHDPGFDWHVVHDGDVQECFKGLAGAGVAKLLHQVGYAIWAATKMRCEGVIPGSMAMTA
jgi:hypothetical protein